MSKGKATVAAEFQQYFQTTPFSHQYDEWVEHKADRARGLLWEMGTGKTKETIDQFTYLYDKGEVDCLLVVAPDGVHRNWITDELPAHLPERLRAGMLGFAYQSDKTTTKWHQAACEQALAHPGLLCVAMSYDAAVTAPLMERDKVTGKRTTTWRGGKKFLWDILRTRKCMYVADEARRIKNPKADRTKVVTKSAVFAPYRRLLNGTPVPNGPFDLYSQLKFLDEHFWEPHGISTYSAFKQMFGVFQKGCVRDANGKLREFDQLLDYKNLDLLQRIIGTICSRVTKEDVLDLPPKLYTRHAFEMTATQRKVYEQLRDDFMATMEDGSTVTAPLAITRLLRFQQVTSGFVPVEDGDEPVMDIGKANPRLELLGEICEDIPHSAIIWCRFNRTVDKIMDMLGKRAVRYDGQVSSDDRAAAKDAFQGGDVQFFVAKASTAGEGLTLHRARTVIYVENTFDLAARLQSEDRAHRIGQEFPVSYLDLVALGTVDEQIVKALREKFDVANQITGDRMKEWLRV